MFAIRYWLLWALSACTLLFIVLAAQGALAWEWIVLPLFLTVFGLRDLLQRPHAILRNYPLLGQFRFLFEAIRPEIRQYFFESENDGAPFTRKKRSLVYQRAKGEVDSRPFGTELDVKSRGYEWIGHSLSPSMIASCDFRVTVGAGRPKPYEMSVFNVSAMSFGALSANAIRALNHGAKKGRFAHDTGEGSISMHHREFGGDLIWQVASGYFGCRNADGSFNDEKFAEQACDDQVKMITIKLSQGAKPGHGGILPAAKITPEISITRGVPMGIDCVSPAVHPSFSTPLGLIDFIEKLRNLSGGKPVGIKLCIGHPWEFFGIVKAMLQTNIVPDFIVVDGAEGGTGAAPLEFTDHVGMPLQEGLLMVHNTLVGAGLRDRVKIGAAGKIITAFDIARTLALGADWCNSGRGFMFALGCIQSQSCHTDRCPTGVATQNPGRARALVVPDKAERVYRFHQSTLHALQELVQAAGLPHTSALRAHHIVRRINDHEVQLLSELLKYLEPGDLLTGNYRYQVYEKYWPVSRAESFHPVL